MKKLVIGLLILFTCQFSWATVRSFDNTNDEIDMGAVLDITTGDVSLCIHANLTEDAEVDAMLGKKSDSAFTTAGCFIYQSGSADIGRIQCADGTDGEEAGSTAQLDDGVWHGFCGTWNGTTKTVRAYEAGVLNNTSTDVLVGSVTNAVEFASGETGNEGEDANGLMAYAMQFSGVLTAAEVAEILWRPGIIVATKTSAATSATSGGTFANDTAVGTIAWSTPSNASASDDSRTTATMLLGEVSNYLKVTNFGFSIPTDATIEGILMSFEAQSTVLNSIDDSTVSLVKSDGTVGSTNKAIATDWPTSDTYRDYGSVSDLWGETWYASDINDTDFGVVISAVDILGAAVAGVDHVRITIYYTTGVAGTMGGYWPMYGGDSPETDLSANGFDGTVSNASTNAGGPPVMIGDMPI